MMCRAGAIDGTACTSSAAGGARREPRSVDDCYLLWYCCVIAERCLSNSFQIEQQVGGERTQVRACDTTIAVLKGFV